ncbi:uncharacterized protein [Ambystoma mexicanum]|uniref:uncharacterized protein n=1 Tax=Ambystoma mexicanum TaxID=8296 RepID=UPI0037E7820C
MAQQVTQQAQEQVSHQPFSHQSTILNQRLDKIRAASQEQASQSSVTYQSSTTMTQRVEKSSEMSQVQVSQVPSTYQSSSSLLPRLEYNQATSQVQLSQPSSTFQTSSSTAAQWADRNLGGFQTSTSGQQVDRSLGSFRTSTTAQQADRNLGGFQTSTAAQGVDRNLGSFRTTTAAQGVDRDLGSFRASTAAQGVDRNLGSSRIITSNPVYSADARGPSSQGVWTAPASSRAGNFAQGGYSADACGPSSAAFAEPASFYPPNCGPVFSADACGPSSGACAAPGPCAPNCAPERSSCCDCASMGLMCLMGLMSMIWIGLGVAQIVIGSVYLDSCPLQRYIPIYLIVSGVTILAIAILTAFAGCRRSKCLYAFIGLLSLFWFAWLIAGSVWTFPHYPNYAGCNRVVYLFAFSMLIIQWILLAMALPVLLGKLCTLITSCTSCCPCSSCSLCSGCSACTRACSCCLRCFSCCSCASK